MTEGEDRPGWMAGPPPPPPGPGPSGGSSSPSGPPYSGPPRPPAGERRAGAGAGSVPAHQRLLGEFRDGSPWATGAGVILAAVGVGWLSDILLAFRHDPGETAQDRLLSFFGLASVGWALAVLVAVALLAAGRRFELGSPAPGRLRESVTLAAAGAALVVGLSAALDVLIELANFGHGMDQALAGLIGYLAVIPMAGAAAWWAVRQHTASR